MSNVPLSQLLLQKYPKVTMDSLMSIMYHRIQYAAKITTIYIKSIIVDSSNLR